MLYLTGTALNVQSLLGVIFMIGIVVSNTVLLTDFAQNLRKVEDLTPTEAIRRVAGIRVRPVVMTALATFFALIPMSLGLARGSEANGLLAGPSSTASSPDWSQRCLSCHVSTHCLFVARRLIPTTNR
jgi:multidrug efflux pump subunit AcrB